MSKKSVVFEISDVVDFIHALNNWTDDMTEDDVFKILKPKIQSRSICEENLELRQPIPYVTIFDTHTKSFLAYDRGSKGDENRLFKRTSVGFGGHIETLPENNVFSRTFVDKEAAREVYEEVDLGMSEDEIFAILSKTTVIVGSDLRWSPVTDPTEHVNRVHMKFVYFMEIDSSNPKYAVPTSKEPGVITNLRWLSLDDAREGLKKGIFEDWSVSQIESSGKL